MFVSAPHAYPELGLSGLIKQFPMDFQVVEELGFEPSGTGEHIYLWIRKQHCNTHDVAIRLAKLAKIPEHYVGYAGRKDKHAVTSQWFSVYLEKHPEPNWHDIENDNIEIHTITRGEKKCRIGVHQGNQFSLTIRNIDLQSADWESRLNLIKTQGFPNYFAMQRFGRDEQNLEMATKMFTDPRAKRSRFAQSTALSAARSFLFNEILAKRIATQTWTQILPGDVAMFKDGHSVFTAGEEDQTRENLAPCASLFGAGNDLQTGVPAEIESGVLAEHALFRDGLLKNDLKRQWRSLVEYPLNMTWFVQSEQCLCLSFSLRRGVYATALLRELMDVLHVHDLTTGAQPSESALFED